MDSGTRGPVRRTLSCLLVLLATVVVAQDDVRPPGKEKAHVTVSVLRTAPGGATQPTMAMGPLDLAVGERIPPTVFAAGAAGVDSQGCEARMTMEPPEAVLGRFSLVWTVTAEVRSIETDRIVLDVTWQRLKRGENGPPPLAGVPTRESITLREGERVLLDFADGARPDWLCARNFAIELTAGLAEDPALARRQIAYDVWLVHEAPGGQRQSRHLELTANQGEESAFQFPHQRLPAAVAAKGSGAEEGLQVDVKGTLRGRVRPDGAIDLSLRTNRSLWYVSPDGSGEHVGDGGEKILSVHAQETIRVDLPGATRNTQQPDRYARDLSGHSFALVLQARPLESR
jgi:hypothetical protein